MIGTLAIYKGSMPVRILSRVGTRFDLRDTRGYETRNVSPLHISDARVVDNLPQEYLTWAEKRALGLLKRRGTVRVSCALKGCENWFVRASVQHKFCSPQCERSHARRGEKFKPPKVICRSPGCGNVLVPKTGRNRFCSDLCRSRSRVRLKASRLLRRRRCKFKSCRSLFQPFRKNQDFCSTKCRSLARVRSKLRPVVQKVCAMETCGKTFETTSWRFKYCSPLCASKQSHLSDMKSRECLREDCGKTFRTSGPRRKFCSSTCRWTHQSRVKRDIPLLTKACRTCTQEYQTKNLRSAFCSKPCRITYWNKKRNLPSRRNSNPSI